MQTSEITLSTEKNKLDIPFIHNFLTNSYWAEGISLDIVKKSIDNSLCFGIYENEKQLGFARVITDYSSFAYLLDVFIDENYRGKGFSLDLLNFVINNPEFKDVKMWMLATTDAHGLYKKFGFEIVNNPEKIMVLKK